MIKKDFIIALDTMQKGMLSFVKKQNVNFIEAVEILAKKAGLQMPEQDPQAKEKSSYRDNFLKLWTYR